MLSKEELMDLFDEAIDDKTMTEGTALTLIVDIEEYPEFEEIKVLPMNLPYKKKYIEETYDDELVHKHSPNVQITGCRMTKMFI